MTIDLNKYNKTLKEAMGDNNPEAKYYFIVESDYYIPGHYWNDDIKAYTPEGDDNGSDPDEIYGFYTWDEMLDKLDDMLLLDDRKVPEEPITEIDHIKNGHKVLTCYEVEREVEMDDEEGYRGIYYYSYGVFICEKGEFQVTPEKVVEDYNEEMVSINLSVQDWLTMTRLLMSILKEGKPYDIVSEETYNKFDIITDKIEKQLKNRDKEQ